MVALHLNLTADRTLLALDKAPTSPVSEPGADIGRRPPDGAVADPATAEVDATGGTVSSFSVPESSIGRS